jgi:hypothetical protein
VRQPHHPTVGIRPLELLTTRPPDSHVHYPLRLLVPTLTLRMLSAHCSLLHTTVGADSRCSAWHTGQSCATTDSPVNYSGVAPRKPEGGKFRVDLPGAPDIVRWHTG